MLMNIFLLNREKENIKIAILIYKKPLSVEETQSCPICFCDGSLAQLCRSKIDIHWQKPQNMAHQIVRKIISKISQVISLK